MLRRSIISVTEPALGLRSRRALFYVPGSDERKFAKTRTTNADCVVYDLEDSVSFNKKGDARHYVLNALEVMEDRQKGKAAENVNAEKAVRINAIRSGLELDDLNAIVTVASEPLQESIRLIASVESALGIMNIKEIATADPRMDALIFAAEDYCADLSLIHTGIRKEMSFARQMTVNAASAFGLQSLDLVCVDFKNPDVLRDECKEGREFGFTGKQAIHPAQIDIIQEMFLPDPNDLERATRILQGFEHYAEKGVGAFNLDGKMIDMWVVKWAQKVLSKAQAGGMDMPQLENPTKKVEEINMVYKHKLSTGLKNGRHYYDVLEQ